MTAIMFDTQIYDCILENNLIDKLILLKSKNKTEFLTTQIQIDELSAIPDIKIEKRQKLVLYLVWLRPEIVLTSGALFGVSKWGFLEIFECTYFITRNIDLKKYLDKKWNQSVPKVIDNSIISYMKKTKKASYSKVRL